MPKSNSYKFATNFDGLSFERPKATGAFDGVPSLNIEKLKI